MFIMNTYRVGPGVPGGSEGTASSNGGVVQDTVGGVLVTDDVSGAVGIGGNVAIVRGRGGPGVELVASVGTSSDSPLLVETSIGGAINRPRGNVAVGVDQAGTGGQGEGEGSLGRHLEMV